MFTFFKKTNKQSLPKRYDRININHCFPENWETFYNFKLYSKNEAILMDLLIFVPECGLLSGERISWTHNELQDASVERSSAVRKKQSTTQLSTKETAIKNKLKDVLSFDSTPIAHFFWFPLLTEDEFDSLHSSFQELLPKTQIIFADESCETVYAKLSVLLPKLDLLLSENKIAGALEAHLQLLPDDQFPFGKRLSYRDRLFLYSPIGELCTISGPCKSGRTSLMVRKALQHYLKHRDAHLYFISPNQLNNDLIRQEFISLLDLAALEHHDVALSFLTPSECEKAVDSTILSSSKNPLFFIDDFHLIHSDLQTKLLTLSPVVRTCIHSYSEEPVHFNIQSVACDVQHETYPEAISWEDVLSSLNAILDNHKRIYSSQDFLIIVPNQMKLIDMQNYLLETKEIASQILDETFSLQFKNTDTLLLTTPFNASGIIKKAVIVIGPDQTESSIYSHMLSRGTDKAIIIPYNNPQQETNAYENNQE